MGLTLEELQQSFIVKRLKIVDASASDLDVLRQNYVAALGRIQQKYETAGRLDEALLSKEEIGLVSAETWPMPPMAKAAPRDLVSARKLYIRNHIEFQKKAALSLVKAAEKMDRLLSEKVISLTKEGDLEAARKAQTIQESIEEDKVLTAARALVQRVGKDGSSPVALRIRRVGDDLEVEVRYDISGKISLQSPVENVVEITGGRKEKGSTEAKNLGEFLGGKGFTVDPYVAMDKNFADREVGLMRFTALDSDFDRNEAGEAALRLEVSANPENIHISIGDYLPALSEKGTVRVELRYFVPKSNKFINGLKFVQAELGPIPGSLTTKVGEWEDFGFDVQSGSENPRLLMYLNSKERVPEPRLTGDSVFISRLRVSHQAMSAYLVKEFDRQGGESLVQLAADQQSLFALNGALVPKE